jgi:hypothetical protein
MADPSLSMLLRMELAIALVVESTASAMGFSVSSAIFKDAFAEKGSLTKKKQEKWRF